MNEATANPLWQIINSDRSTRTLLIVSSSMRLTLRTWSTVTRIKLWLKMYFCGHFARAHRISHIKSITLEVRCYKRFSRTAWACIAQNRLYSPSSTKLVGTMHLEALRGVSSIPTQSRQRSEIEYEQRWQQVLVLDWRPWRYTVYFRRFCSNTFWQNGEVTEKHRRCHLYLYAVLFIHSITYRRRLIENSLSYIGCLPIHMLRWHWRRWHRVTPQKK